MITIVESGGANIASIIFALERLGVRAQLSADPEVIKNASHIILPGVGMAEQAMKHLKMLGLEEVLRSLTQPVLGICLGMQILFESSEEGDVNCLNIIPGQVKKLAAEKGCRIPHMGWNTLNIRNRNGLMQDIPDSAAVYFIHSYAVPVTDQTAATTAYGTLFSAVVQHHNFFGTQFHPERSGPIGMKILKNFLEIA